MLLITVGLVLVGIVFLAIGVITQTTALLLISIACAVIAGVTLLVQSRASRREAAPAPTGAAPAPAPSPPAPAPAPAPEPARELVAEPAPEPLTARLAPVGAEEGGAESRSWPSPPPPPPPAPVAVVEDEEFPIADYDDLRVSEILPLLPELELDELEAVRRREEQGKNRSVVIDRIDDLIDELEAEEVEVEVVTTTSEDFPIEDYDALSAEQILPLLPQLDDDELDMVYEREEQGQNRAVILDAIDDMFEEEPLEPEPLEPEPAIAAPPAPPARAVKTVKKVSVKKVPAKKAPAKKVSVKKVPAKKAVPVKKAAPGKKVSVKKVSVKKAAPAKKVAAKKVAAKKVSVKKVSVKKVTKAAKAAKKR